MVLNASSIATTQTIPAHGVTSIALLPASIQTIIQAIYKQHGKMKPSLLRKIVMEAGVTSDDLMPWADYSHPLADSYGRKLVFSEQFFEIMVMSWVPGDTSAIHDHGYTQWGAVQVFGAAEHSTFLVQDETLKTLSRVTLQPGQVLAVGHHLIHQMANTSEENFLSLHVYGISDLEPKVESVTTDARIWDISLGVVQRTNGGVFFGLPDHQINSTEPAPTPDYLSWLHNMIDYLYRVRQALQESRDPHFVNLEANLTKELFNMSCWDSFEQELMACVNDAGHITDSKYWNLLRETLIRAAHLQSEILSRTTNSEDSFFTYAELYDEVIGKHCLNSFTAKYIQFVHDHYALDFSVSTILSIGCGTGIMEAHMLNTYQIKRENLLGIDSSAAMIQVASQLINAKVQNILDYDPDSPRWDLCFSSLNVYQYLPKPMMEEAIKNTALLTQTGGYFIGDFITPDHVRWYPNVICSESVISLRQPLLTEQNNNTFQQSEIINVSKLKGDFRITYEGKHTRYLPSLWKIRYLFGKYFGGKVDIFDAVTLDPLLPENDTCLSTRYLVVAQKM